MRWASGEELRPPVDSQHQLPGPLSEPSWKQIPGMQMSAGWTDILDGNLIRSPELESPSQHAPKFLTPKLRELITITGFSCYVWR